PTRMLMRPAACRLLAPGLAACLLLSGGLRAEDAAKLGKKIENVPFHDATGKSFALHDVKDARAIVAVFLSFECPVSNSYAQTLAEVQKVYGPRGVTVFGVCPCDEDAAAVSRHAREFNLPFPVYKDERGAAADALKAEVTPEVFVLDHNFVLRYRGRID